MSHWLAPVLVALIGAFMSLLDSSIVNVAIPTIMGVFNVGTSDVQWVSTIYMLALGVIIPFSGWLGDRIGFKRLYMLSMGLFVVGSLLCTLSWNLNSLVVSRVIQAFGGGMIMPTTMAMIFRMVPRTQIGRAMGIYGIALMVAPAIGPTLGGYLVDFVDWRWIFTINLPVGAIGILLAFFVLPEFQSKHPGRLDLAGGFTAAGALFCLLLALNKGADCAPFRRERFFLRVVHLSGAHCGQSAPGAASVQVQVLHDGQPRSLHHKHCHVHLDILFASVPADPPGAWGAGNGSFDDARGACFDSDDAYPR
jgi:EmrB/QacA subfamily drug resistance transporter